MRGDPRIYDSPQIRVKRPRQILDLGSGQIQHKNTKTDGRSGSGICVNFTPIPPIHIGLYRRSQIPPGVRCYRGICGRMVSGVVPPHTSHHRVPLASEYPGLPSAPRSATTSTKAETRNEEGKTKMGFQTWATPPAFIAWCEKVVLPVYGFTEFGLDACAEPHNSKAPRFLAPVYPDLAVGPDCVGVNGLNASWANYGAVWCNPGFSECAKWLAKAAKEREEGVTSLILTHATHTPDWYHEHKTLADRWLIPQRINFLPPAGVTPSSNNRDSLLWVHSPLAAGRIFEPESWRN